MEHQEMVAHEEWYEDGSTITAGTESAVDDVDPIANGEFHWISVEWKPAAGACTPGTGTPTGSTA